MINMTTEQLARMFRQSYYNGVPMTMRIGEIGMNLSILPLSDDDVRPAAIFQIIKHDEGRSEAIMTFNFKSPYAVCHDIAEDIDMSIKTMARLYEDEFTDFMDALGIEEYGHEKVQE